MKKLSLIPLLFTCFMGFAQNYYDEQKSSNIDQNRVKIAKSFSEEFIKKCETKNTGKFESYSLSERVGGAVNVMLEKKCPEMLSFYGKIESLQLNSAYTYNKTDGFPPVDMYVFDIKSKKKAGNNLINVLVLKENNTISGFMFSNEKPLNKALK